MQSIKLTIEGHEIKLAARVRHLQKLDASAGAGPSYRIGLEFLEEPAVLVHALE
jgi:hypothetical protein